LTDNQDFSALRTCKALTTIHAEQNPISFLPNGINQLSPDVTLHLNEKKVELSAKIETSVFNGLRSMGRHAHIDISGETASTVTQIARMETHTKNVEEVNRKIKTLQK